MDLLSEIYSKITFSFHPMENKGRREFEVNCFSNFISMSTEDKEVI